MSDVVVSAFTPDVSSGQGLRTYGLVRALAALGPVELLYVPFGADEPAAEYGAAAGVSLRPVRSSRGARRTAAYARALAGGVPDGFARGVSAELARAADRRVASGEVGRLIADGPVAAATLLPLLDRRELTYNAHNIESSFRHRIGSMSHFGRRRLERFERRLLERVAEAWMASPADVEMARALAPGTAVRYVPNVVDVARIEPASSRGDGVLFIGDFRYPPNRAGLDYLTREVMPLLWRERPEAILRVVGRGLEDRPSADRRVSHLGFVADLSAAYAQAACVAIPLLAGGGSPLKFVEALAYGSSVVATPTAAAGLEARSPDHYLEASDAPTFAASLAELLGGEHPELGTRARQLALTSYSIESLSERLAGRR